MPIVSSSPRTRHQVAQLKARAARDAATKATSSPKVNRIFGAGVYAGEQTYDCYGNPTKPRLWNGVTDADRHDWAIESDHLAEMREARAALIREEEEQDAWDRVEAEDRQWVERQVHGVMRAAYYGW
jgi:hypothetical protein